MQDKAKPYRTGLPFRRGASPASPEKVRRHILKRAKRVTAWLQNRRWADQHQGLIVPADIDRPLDNDERYAAWVARSGGAA